MQSADDAAQVIDAFYAAYNRGDVEAVMGLYTPDAQHVEVAQARVAEGRAQIRSGLEGFLQSFPDARWEPQRAIVEGDRAAVRYVLTGTLQERLGPFEPQGQMLRLRGVHLFCVRDGLVVETEDFWDSGTFAKQMRSD